MIISREEPKNVEGGQQEKEPTFWAQDCLQVHGEARLDCQCNTGRLLGKGADSFRSKIAPALNCSKGLVSTCVRDEKVVATWQATVDFDSEADSRTQSKGRHSLT